MPKCCAIGCRKEGGHLFPKNEELRKLWEIALRRKDFKATKYSRICSDHFRTEDYIQESYESGVKLTRKILKKGVIPSLFVWSKNKIFKNELQRKSVERCEDRLQKNRSKSSEAVDVNINNVLKIKMVGVATLSSHDIPTATREASTQKNYDIPSTPPTIERSTQKNYQFFCMETFKHNDKAIQFYTGLESYEKFKFVFSSLGPDVHSMKYRWSQVLNISLEEQFFLTLIKLRRNKQNFELALLFDISETTVSNIFVTWINFIHQMWSMLNVWPNKDLLKHCMPDEVKDYPTTVDGTQQIRAQKHKHQLSVNEEVIETTRGPELLNHCSEIYGGSKSDSQTSNHKHIERLKAQTNAFSFLQHQVRNRYSKLMPKAHFVCLMLCHFREGVVPNAKN